MSPPGVGVFGPVIKARDLLVVMDPPAPPQTQ